MSDDESTARTIDWSTAEVRDGRLTVALDDKPAKEWAKRFARVLERLGGRGGGDVEVVKQEIRVSAVEAGTEGDVRHRLEAAVLQVNADLAPEPEDDEEGTEGSEEDRSMTEAFRAFAPGDTGTESGG